MSHHLQRLAVISTHTSPLARPGTTKAGGMNVYIAELARQLARTGRSVDIFTRRDALDLDEVVPLAPNVRLLHLDAGPREPLAPTAVAGHVAEFTHEVERLVRAEGTDYDLVHSHYWLSGLSGLALAERWRRPHVAMFHTLGEVKNRARRAEAEPKERIQAERRIVDGADLLICATPHEKDFLVQLYGASEHCVRVVPGGVDLDHFRPGDREAARAALDLPAGRLVLFVGRLEPLKGVDILIRAIAAAELSEPATLMILGGDEQEVGERQRLREVVANTGLDGQVRFLPAVDRAVLPTYYQAADLCVVPSYYESFGLVAVEALACGTPVIATRVGGLQYTVRDGRSGYLISWRCPEPFAERIEALLENPQLLERFGAAAPASVRRFEWEAVAGQIIEVYEELAEWHALGASCRGAAVG